MPAAYPSPRTIRYAASLIAFWLALSPAVVARSAARAPVSSPTRTVLVMGDSLSAAYGLRASEGWVALTEKRLTSEARGWRVVNASVSGETTAGGAARIASALKRHRPAIVVIELGVNDGLRGLPLAHIRSNLDKMIKASQAHGSRVLLVGMRLPPNYGATYTGGFERIYAELAATYKTSLVPFLLQPVMRDRAAFQADNLHPSAATQPKLRDHVWPALKPLLR